MSTPLRSVPRTHHRTHGRFAAAIRLLALALALLPSGAMTHASDALFPDEVLARGRGFEIRQSQLDDAFIQLRAALAARGRPLLEAERGSAEGTLLDRLVIIQVLLQQATADDRTPATTSAERAFEAAKAQSSSPETFRRQLTALGVDMEKFRQRLFEQALLEEIVRRIHYRTIDIKPEDIRRYYDENPRVFERPELVRLRHLLISTVDGTTGRPLPDKERAEKRALCERLLQRAKAGEDFVKLIQEFTDDPGSRQRGGEYRFARAKDNPGMAAVPEFEQAAFSLQPNQFSDVVATRYGFHIIQVLERIPPEKQAFAAAEADIRLMLQQKEGRKYLPGFFERLKKEAGVEIVSEKLRNAPRLKDVEAEANPLGK